MVPALLGGDKPGIHSPLGLAENPRSPAAVLPPNPSLLSWQREAWLLFSRLC